MFGGDKKGLALAILAKKGPPGPPDPMEEEAEGEDMGGDDTIAAEDLISAIRARDASGVASAFRALMAACDSGMEEESEGDELA